MSNNDVSVTLFQKKYNKKSFITKQEDRLKIISTNMK